MAKKVSGILEAIEIAPLQVGSMEVWLKGETPLILNRMAAKAKRQLLFPPGKLTQAEKDQRLKHDPLSEYRDSMSVRPGRGPTRIVFPAPGVKGAMATAALETPGTNKTQIGRLVWVDGYEVPVYGVPKLHMAVVRQADKARTPDVRTRAILEEWCIPVRILFVKPQLNEKAICQLLANGGIIIGVGDFRQEKGKGSHGQFSISTKAACAKIVRAGGQRQQDAAIKKPQCFDADAEELLAWFEAEVKTRGKQEMLTAKR